MKQIIFFFAINLFAKGLLAQNIGIGTTSPIDKVHINAATGTNALRVDINSINKLRVWSNGGTSIGTATTPPSNGLLVSGPINPQNGISTTAKLIVESTGDSIIMKAGNSQIILSANGNITIKSASGSQLNINASGNLTISSTATLSLNSTVLNLNSSILNITGSGLLKLNGGLIQFNGGNRPIARQGDPVLGGVIVTGNPTVLSN